MKFGTQEIQTVKKGQTDIEKVYLGQTQIFPAFTPGFDVFPIAGQSNAVGINSPNASDTVPDPVLDSSDSDIFQLKQDGTVAVAVEPLDHDDPSNVDDVGFALAFAKWYKENQLTPGRKILLVPSAVGSTGFATNDWNEDDDLYNALVSRTNTALAHGTGVNRHIALLWHQGERDASSGRTAVQYQTDWEAMWTAYKTDIGESDMKAIVGGLIPYHVTNTPSYGIIDTGIRAIAADNIDVALADPSSPTVLVNEVGSNQVSDHYSARNTRGHPTQDFTDVSTIAFAGRYATAYLSLLE